MTVETGSSLTLGMTVIDRRGRSLRPANAQVLDAADADGIYRLLAERLSTLPYGADAAACALLDSAATMPRHAPLEETR